MSSITVNTRVFARIRTYSCLVWTAPKTPLPCSHSLWATVCTRPQQLLRWATVCPQSIDMGRKVGEAAVSLSVGEVGPHLTQCGLGRGLPPYTKWHFGVLQMGAQKWFALCYRTVVCLSCLSVTLMYCGQTVGWIRMPDGDPVTPHGKGHSRPHFRLACVRINRGPCLLWPNGWMDQDTTWYGSRSTPRRHCVR